MGWPTGRHACRPLPTVLLRREGSAHRISCFGVALATGDRRGVRVAMDSRRMTRYALTCATSCSSRGEISEPSSRSARSMTVRAAFSLSGMRTSRTQLRYAIAAGPSGSARTLARNPAGVSILLPVPSLPAPRAACRIMASYEDLEAVTHARSGPYRDLSCSLIRSTRARCCCARSVCSAVVT